MIVGGPRQTGSGFSLLFHRIIATGLPMSLQLANVVSPSLIRAKQSRICAMFQSCYDGM